MKYAKIENGSIVETNVSEIHIQNRNDSGVYLPIYKTVRPIETELVTYTPVYELEVDKVLEKWTPRAKTQTETDKFIADKLEQTKQSLTQAVQEHLDSNAKEKGYDNILSACSYAGYTNPFQSEGQTYVVWRGDVWAKCYTVMAEVEAGTRTIPTSAELVAELPLLVLP